MTTATRPTTAGTSAEVQALIAASHAIRAERRRIEAIVDRVIDRYGERVPGLAAALSLIEDRQAIELASEVIDLVATVRSAEPAGGRPVPRPHPSIACDRS
jgi:hypothetical protein